MQSEPVRLAAAAMACRWELALFGDDPARLRAAGQEAIHEIRRAEELLSAFRPGSIVSLLNDSASAAPVSVPPSVFGLLSDCAELHRATGGAFDITIRPLLEAWGLRGDVPAAPRGATLGAVLARTGSGLLRLDPEARTVRFGADGMSLDLGAVGKGYAADLVAELLDELGIGRWLLHGGTSTVACRGGEPARIGIPHPAEDGRMLCVVALRDGALGVSGALGRQGRAGDRHVSHVLDPRTGLPVSGASLAAVTGPSAMRCDALSTALLVGGADGLEGFIRPADGYEGMVVGDRSADVVATSPGWPGT